MDTPTKIALISDTHNLLRPEVYPLLEDVSCILHIGDVGTEAVLDSLNDHAPTYAVRGNVDRGPWAEKLPTSYGVQIGKWQINMIHIKEEWSQCASKHSIPHILLVGHSHKPAFTREGETFIINPGSAGRRRFSLPITMARLELKEEHAIYRLYDLGAEGKIMQCERLSFWEV
ncbi:MAG: metallophosphoesterase family protein [Bacteroidota bacterium]